MSNQGIQSLGDIAITTAGTIIGAWVTGFQNLLALTVGLRLAYGSGGATIKAYVQTSLDQGTTAVDIASVAFATASENQMLNFSSLTPKTTQVTPGDGVLADDTAVDGILGDRFRVKIISTGTYANTVLSVRAHPHT